MHNNINENRIVVLGARGFVGHTICQRLLKDRRQVLPLDRQTLDLLHVEAAEQLFDLLCETDILVIAVAEAPCKTSAMFYQNISMIHPVCEVLKSKPVSHIIYISSDAVYADSELPLTEYSETTPSSLHGIMHLSREMLLRNDCLNLNIPLIILRPSLLYGAEDPHNGYGPNQFFRLASKGQSIVLFGEGEELRDHVYIEDVAEIISRVIDKGITGVFNIATGQVFSFKEIAEKIKQLVDPAIKIESLPRSGPMPHNGYRSFNTSLVQSIFTGFSHTTLLDGFLCMQRQMKETSCVTN